MINKILGFVLVAVTIQFTTFCFVLLVWPKDSVKVHGLFFFTFHICNKCTHCQLHILGIDLIDRMPK